jgi:hypothetical protein
MMKTCRECEAPVKRAGLCTLCRAERRRSKVRGYQARYEAKKESTVPMWTAVEEIRKAAPLAVIKLVPPPPLRGRHTPRGPNEGVSTTKPDLQLILDQNARVAAEHSWWEENPDVFSNL